MLFCGEERAESVGPAVLSCSFISIFKKALRAVFYEITFRRHRSDPKRRESLGRCTLAPGADQIPPGPIRSPRSRLTGAAAGARGWGCAPGRGRTAPSGASGAVWRLLPHTWPRLPAPRRGTALAAAGGRGERAAGASSSSSSSSSCPGRAAGAVTLRPQSRPQGAGRRERASSSDGFLRGARRSPAPAPLSRRGLAYLENSPFWCCFRPSNFTFL